MAITYKTVGGPSARHLTRLHAAASRKILFVLLQIALITFSLVLMGTQAVGADWEGYLFWCRYGLAVLLVSIASYAGIAGRVITPSLFILMAFVAFQFGIPILCGIVEDYSNYYMQYLNNSTLTGGAAYTVVCLQALTLGMSLVHGRSAKGLLGLGKRSFLSDVGPAVQAAMVVFVVMGIIVIPRAVMFLDTSAAMGIAAARDAYDMGSIENIARGLFVPSGLLMLAYLRKSTKRSIVLAVMWIYALIVVFSGDRTEGLTLVVTLLFFSFGMEGVWEQGQKTPKRANLLRPIIIVLSAFAILWLLVTVASIRVGGEASFMSVGDVVVSAFDEMGFNFLTICFQTQIAGDFSYGLTYLTSLSTLIPSSLDFAGIKDLTSAVDPTTQYYAAMSAQYPWASFGLGYTLVAESYVNFGYYGWPMLLLTGMVIEWLIQGTDGTRFGRYLSLVFLWSFLTLPRRQTTWLVNSFEYDLIFMLLILWAWHSIAKGRGTKEPKSSRGTGTHSGMR